MQAVLKPTFNWELFFWRSIQFRTLLYLLGSYKRYLFDHYDDCRDCDILCTRDWRSQEKPLLLENGDIQHKD